MTCGVPLEFFWIKFGVMKILFPLNYVWWHFTRIIANKIKKSATNETFLISTGCDKFYLKEKCSRINDAAINLICVF